MEHTRAFRLTDCRFWHHHSRELMPKIANAATGRRRGTWRVSTAVNDRIAFDSIHRDPRRDPRAVVFPAFVQSPRTTASFAGPMANIFHSSTFPFRRQSRGGRSPSRTSTGTRCPARGPRVSSRRFTRLPRHPSSSRRPRCPCPRSPSSSPSTARCDLSPPRDDPSVPNLSSFSILPAPTFADLR